jgi:hypothetical protein
MSAGINNNLPPERPGNQRFAPPSKADIPDENFEPYDTYTKPKKHSGKKVATALLIIVLLLAAGAGAYELFLKSKLKPAPKAATQTTQRSNTLNAASSTSLPAAPTKHYDSAHFNLGIDYPQTWTITDADGIKLTIKSPRVNLVAATGSTASGEIVITVQNKQTTLPDFVKGSAMAVLNSDTVAYTKPTSNQRANTNLSYLQYAATTTNGALDGIYITGNNGYQKGQSVPQADISGVDPLVTVSFAACADDTCASPKPLSVQASSWQTTSQAAATKAMLQSLSLK